MEHNSFLFGSSSCTVIFTHLFPPSVHGAVCERGSHMKRVKKGPDAAGADLRRS